MDPLNLDPARARALDRVRKLLALAEDQRGRPEGETARQLALAVASRWRITPQETAEAGPVPEAEVPLGGRHLERYREEYRAMLLAALGELAGCTVSWHPGRWVGKVFGAPDAAREVAEVYEVLCLHLDTLFPKQWMKQRFGSMQRHNLARVWWAAVITFVRHHEDWNHPWETSHIVLPFLDTWPVSTRADGARAIRGLKPELLRRIGRLAQGRYREPTELPDKLMAS